jgi:hypothetical protein
METAMKKEKREKGLYVRKVNRTTQDYIRNIALENEKLHAVLASLENEKSCLESRILELIAVKEENASLRARNVLVES